MIAELSAIVTGTKASIEIASGLIGLKNEADRVQAVLDIQQHLVTAQKTALQLQETIQQLHDRIADLEKFEASNYELVELENNGHRFSGRKAYRELSTRLFFCPTCFAERKLGQIQFNEDGDYANECGICHMPLGSADDRDPGFMSGGQREDWRLI